MLALNPGRRKRFYASMKKKAIAKRPRGRPATGKGEQVVVRIQPDLMDALDKQVEATGAGTRAEAIRRILAAFLKQQGVL